jgi:hypothetical protein
MKDLVKIGAATLAIMTFLGLYRLGYLKEEYIDTKGPFFITIESYEEAKESGALVAMYKPHFDREQSMNKPLSIQLATHHTNGFQSYSEKFYLNPQVELDGEIKSLVIDCEVLEVNDGEIHGLYEIKTLPDSIFALNSIRDTIETFLLAESYDSYLDLRGKKSYLKEWLRIINE